MIADSVLADCEASELVAVLIDARLAVRRDVTQSRRQLLAVNDDCR
jgi:hypothetical protein